MKILVLEDNTTLAKVIKQGLEKENYKVDLFSDGNEALLSIVNGYSAYILDINVPSLDGISILKDIRDYNENIPVIIISSNHELEKIKSSYEYGCNDYLKKPFFIYELVQKLNNLCTNKNKSIQFSKECQYNINENILYDNNEKIILTKKEILLLELFGKNINKVISYHEIEEYVWEGAFTNLDNIRSLIKKLRKKLPPNSIKIVSSIGYTLSEDVQYN